MMKERKVELLAPAGNAEKLRVALAYGADAVYCGDATFGLRAGDTNFSRDELTDGINYAHGLGKKVYVTVNIYPHQAEFAELPGYLRFLAAAKADGILVADMGVWKLARDIIPEMPLHVSTQANTVNAMAAKAWESMGAKRIVLARELSLAEIKEIRAATNTELEIFVHGAMCVSYSGRCLLSNYLTERDANRGKCAQACRWRYVLTEEKRPGQYFPIEEDSHGTYILNAKDLSLMPHIGEIIAAGVDSLKIEGRRKSVHYVAGVVKAYRAAIDAYYANPKNFIVHKKWLHELEQVSHRPYTAGFFNGTPAENLQFYGTSSYIRQAEFLGMVLSYDEATGMATVARRNTLRIGDKISIMQPTAAGFSQILTEMYDEFGTEIGTAPHAGQIVRIKTEQPTEHYAIIRKEVQEQW